MSGDESLWTRVRALRDDPAAVEVVAWAINPVAKHPLDRAWATEEAQAAILAVAALIQPDTLPTPTRADVDQQDDHGTHGGQYGGDDA